MILWSCSDTGTNPTKNEPKGVRYIDTTIFGRTLVHFDEDSFEPFIRFNIADSVGGPITATLIAHQIDNVESFGFLIHQDSVFLFYDTTPVRDSTERYVFWITDTERRVRISAKDEPSLFKAFCFDFHIEPFTRGYGNGSFRLFIPESEDHMAYCQRIIDELEKSPFMEVNQ